MPTVLYCHYFFPPIIMFAVQDILIWAAVSHQDRLDAMDQTRPGHMNLSAKLNSEETSRLLCTTGDQQMKRVQVSE